VLFAALVAIAFHANAASAQLINALGNAVPLNPVDDTYAVTLGVKFWSSEPGTITGIRFYRAVASPGGYIAKLYSANGTLLGSATIARESGPLPGWQVAEFASPISIAANATYIASYYSPVGGGAWDVYGLAQGVTNGSLTFPASSAIGGNGVYNYGNVFPSSVYMASNYYVDIEFVPAASTPHLVLSFDPPAPRVPSNAAAGSVVATIVPSWSDGTPFTGTLAFAPPYSNAQGVFAISGMDLIINPSGPGVASSDNNAFDITIVATQ
jgi:hypothetical protein